METTWLTRIGATAVAASAAAAVIAACAAARPDEPTPLPAAPVEATTDASVRSIEITYTAHDGTPRHAVVLAPASYAAGDAPLPLVISPHGRGLKGEINARLWGDLPARGGFVVVNPDGEGEHLSGRFSWGAPGQIDDLARMPRIVETALPWLHIDRSRIYAVGGSMGGQETLLLLARYPHLLAGAVAVDPVADFGRQYASYHEFSCNKICESHWGGPIGDTLQRFSRREVGGTPEEVPAAYGERSPLSYVKQIAAARVPLVVWWSRTDRIVRHSRLQSGLLVKRIRANGGDVRERVGSWVHTHPLRYDRQLPEMLAEVGLLPS